MRTRFVTAVAIIGVALGAGWYVFAQTEGPPDLLPPFTPNWDCR
jgi:hypothetical protein